MRLLSSGLALLAFLLVAAPPAAAVDPPPNEGFAVACMYSYFDDVNGPQDGDLGYPEYFLFTPMDIYTVVYYLEGAAQELAGFSYSVHFRQGGQSIQYGVHYGYLLDEFVPGHEGEVVVSFRDDHLLIVPLGGFPHHGEPVVVRHSQILLLNVPLPGASIEVYFEPEDDYQDNLEYLDNADLDIIYEAFPNSVGHAHENPVFVFEGDVVPVDSRSLSALKQLFR